MQAIRELVDGRTVALVGNATSLLEQRKGKEIDIHDVVIRMNAGLPPYVHGIGERTTIWATARDFYAEIPRLPKAEAVLWMKLTPLGDYEYRRLIQTRASLPPVIERWPQALETQVRDYVGADPGTGIRLLWWLKTEAQPSAINVFGMDCWQTPTTWHSYAHAPAHAPDLERQAMERLCS